MITFSCLSFKNPCLLWIPINYLVNASLGNLIFGDLIRMF